MNFCTPGKLDDSDQVNKRGFCAELRKNGLNPVVADVAQFIANSIAGNLLAQSF
ncbi:hypothetical protein AURDEDRAFT_76215 [Auricularia subglabra TFB-10046 SS5]|uniref:Uncharacterized protein n=1 Tax=Auricularia subglabra (strain TFB-10046 / SS5) TaxID=717982 RepID=J0LCX9_AURST|nr:hypothetical protein AURDEDRAFT_76215 [Auricularia subglabra TFB-10046 SS5]